MCGEKLPLNQTKQGYEPYETVLAQHSHTNAVLYCKNKHPWMHLLNESQDDKRPVCSLLI